LTDDKASKYVYDFAEGNKELKDLLGGKGANLAEMTNLGLPVPPGFTITTEACKTYLETGSTPESLNAEVAEHLEALEQARGKKLGRSSRLTRASSGSTPTPTSPRIRASR
jgi:pyruvate,orthophosphate dikinase